MMIVEKYLEELKKLDNDNLKSVCLIGSYASKINYIPKKSDIDILIVFNFLNFEILNYIMPLTYKFKRKHNVSSLPLSIQYIKESLDVFPVEFHDMQLNYKVLLGEDVLKPLKFSKNDMRLQCEQQIKGVIIRLRSYFLEFGFESKNIINLILSSFKTLFPVFRAIIYLHNQKVEIDNRLLIGQLSKTVDYDLFSFQKLIKNMYEKIIIPKNDIVKFFENYLIHLKFLSEYMDKFDVK